MTLITLWAAVNKLFLHEQKLKVARVKSSGDIFFHLAVCQCRFISVCFDCREDPDVHIAADSSPSSVPMIQAALVLQQKHWGSINSKTKTVLQTDDEAVHATDQWCATMHHNKKTKQTALKKINIEPDCFSFILTILATLMHMSFLCEMCSLRSESNIYCIYNLWNWKICTLIWSSCQSTEQLFITTLYNYLSSSNLILKKQSSKMSELPETTWVQKRNLLLRVNCVCIWWRGLF